MSTYHPQIDPLLYGLHIPYDQGYDAQSQRNYPAAEGHSASGFFHRADGTQIDLWVTEVEADFSVSGQTGQSRMLREFFPRNLNDISLKISGNVSSTQEYNRLAAFVRESHWRALQSITQGHSTTPTIVFGLYDSPDGNGVKPFDNALRNTKGSHRPMLVNGYIKNISGGATAHEVAPEFSVSFVITEALRTGTNAPIWVDTPAAANQLKTFLQIIGADEKVVTGSGFTQNPVTSILPKPQVRNANTGAQALLNTVWSGSAALASFGF